MATAQRSQASNLQSRRARRRGLRWPLILAGGTVALLLAAVVGLYLALFLVTGSDYILPGVSVAGIPVGNQTRSEALNTLQQQWRGTQVRLTADGDSWDVTAADLGLQLDALALVNEAYALGRDGAWLSAPLTLLGLSADLPARHRVDWVQAQSYLVGLAPQVQRRPQDARLYVADGEALALPSVPGRQLDVDGTLAAWYDQWQGGLQVGQLALVTTAIPAAFADAGPLVAEANALLAQPLALNAYDPVRDEVITLTPPDDIRRGWYNFGVVNQRLEVALNSDGIREYLEQTAVVDNRFVPPAAAGAIANALEAGQPTVDVTLRYQPRAHIVQTGETLSSIGFDYGIPYPWIQAANNGLEAIWPGQEIVIPAADALLPLPVVRGKRIRVSLSQQRMWAYENGALKWEWPVSTGIADSPTAPGVFQVQSHELEAYGAAWDLYMPYFMGIYTPAPNVGVMNGFHGFPTRDGRNLLWTGNIGQPVTYGCILVSNDNVQQLYTWAEAGTVVEVVP